MGRHLKQHTNISHNMVLPLHICFFLRGHYSISICPKTHIRLYMLILICRRMFNLSPILLFIIRQTSFSVMFKIGQNPSAVEINNNTIVGVHHMCTWTDYMFMRECNCSFLPMLKWTESPRDEAVLLETRARNFSKWFVSYCMFDVHVNVIIYMLAYTHNLLWDKTTGFLRMWTPFNWAVL
jgi:hypothetical protein